MFAAFFKTEFSVKRLRAKIKFPDAEPENIAVILFSNLKTFGPEG